jgi:hypothetical protein
MQKRRQKYARFSSFLIRGSQSATISAPPDSVWDLIRVIVVDSPSTGTSFHLIGQAVKCEAPFGPPDVLAHLDQDVGSAVQTHLQLNSGFPVIFSLSDQQAAAQIVFATTSDSKLELTALNPIALFPPNFESFFFIEVRKICIADHPFVNLIGYLAAHDRSFFFDGIHTQVPESIQNAIILAIRRMASTLLIQICEFVGVLDQRIWEGHRVATIEGTILVTALTLYPEYVETITAICLQRRNRIVLLAILTKVPDFDPYVFNRLLTTTGREETGAIWLILNFLIVEDVEICGHMVTVFERIFPIRKLQLLMAATRIIPEADLLAGELSPPRPPATKFARPFIIEQTLSVDKPADRTFLMIVTEDEWSPPIHSKAPTLEILRSEVHTSPSSKPLIHCQLSRFHHFSINEADLQEHFQIFGLIIIGIIIVMIQMHL